MSKFSFESNAGSGDKLLKYISNLQLLPPDLARPAYIYFRTTLLKTTTATQAVTKRVNPDYDFAWEGTTVFLETIAGDSTLMSHHAFFDLRESGRASAVLDEPLPMSAFEIASHKNNTYLYSSQGLGGAHHTIPYVFRNGSDITCTFTCDASFSASDHIADVLLYGTYIHKDFTVKDMRELTTKELANLVKSIMEKMKGQ